MAPGFLYVSPKAFAQFLPPYERAIIAALDAIAAEIPHGDLAIQWDVCPEVLAFENYFPAQPVDTATTCQRARMATRPGYVRQTPRASFYSRFAISQQPT